MFLIGLVLAASVTLIQAQTKQAPAFSVGLNSYYTFGSTNFVAAAATGNAVVNGQAMNTPAVTYLNASSDLKTASLVLWYAGGVNAIVTSNSTTSFALSSQSGLVAGNPVVVAHTSTGTVEPRILSSITPVTNTVTIGTNITFNSYPPGLVTNISTTTTYTFTAVVNAALTNSTVAGDVMYGYSAQSTIPVSTNSIGGYQVVAGPAPYILVGQFQTPLLLSIPYTTAGGINTLTGEFK